MDKSSTWEVRNSPINSRMGPKMSRDLSTNKKIDWLKECEISESIWKPVI